MKQKVHLGVLTVFCIIICPLTTHAIPTRDAKLITAATGLLAFSNCCRTWYKYDVDSPYWSWRAQMRYYENPKIKNRIDSEQARRTRLASFMGTCATLLVGATVYHRTPQVQLTRAHHQLSLLLNMPSSGVSTIRTTLGTSSYDEALKNASRYNRIYLDTQKLTDGAYRDFELEGNKKGMEECIELNQQVSEAGTKAEPTT